MFFHFLVGSEKGLVGILIDWPFYILTQKSQTSKIMEPRIETLQKSGDNTVHNEHWSENATSE